MSLSVVSASASDAAEAGLGLLDSKAVSEAQMREYLAGKGFDQTAVDDAVSLFALRGWLDDRDYATELLRQRSSKPGMSRRKLRADMEKRGLKTAEIDAALKALDVEKPDWETQNALALLTRKIPALAQGLDSPNLTLRRKLENKLWRNLVSRGFSSDVAIFAVREALAELEGDDS